MLFTALFFACSPRTENTEKRAAEILQESAPVYLIKPSGSEPFYFELGPAGPVLIASPGEASLSPFMPWTHSRYIFGFLPIFTNDEANPQREALYAAINRGGILEWRNSAGETALYYHPGGSEWEQYPLAAFFRYGKKPTVLLAKENFFSAEEQNPPDPALWALDGGFFEGIAIPALHTGNGGELSAIFQGSGGIWYFRKILPDKETAYFRTADLSQPGQGISAGLYLEASLPLEANSPDVPPLLAWVIAEGARLLGKPCTAAVVSPEFPGRRFFTSPKTASSEAAEIDGEFPIDVSGYYRPSGPDREGFALILFPDGRGVYGRSSAENIIKDGHFTLPSLRNNGPETSSGTESFVYTGASLLGEGSNLYLAAAWEEQKDWNVGAAGFLLLEFSRE